MSRAHRSRNALLIVGMVAVAANLRPVVSGVGPVLDQIRDALDLSSTAAAALLALPIVCFGAMAVMAPLLASRHGHGRTVGLALVGLIAGLLIRAADGVPALFIGTFIAGAAVAVGNVMMPTIVKRSFADRPGFATMLYSSALTGSASLAAAVTIPIEYGLDGDWRLALAIWVVPAALALAIWLPQLGDGVEHAAEPVRLGASLRLLRDPVARQLTIFFGLQAASFYAILSWLPTIFQAEGVSATKAGVLLGVSALMGLPAALTVPGLASRARDQRLFALVFCLSTSIGLAGLILAPTAAPYLWAVLIGIGQGASFPLALTLIVLRSAAVAVTTALSTLVQGGGYLIAALGPLAAGVVHDITGSWSAAVGLLLVALAPQAFAGAIAGRAVHVGERA